MKRLTAGLIAMCLSSGESSTLAGSSTVGGSVALDRKAHEGPEELRRLIGVVGPELNVMKPQEGKRIRRGSAPFVARTGQVTFLKELQTD